MLRVWARLLERLLRGATVVTRAAEASPRGRLERSSTRTRQPVEQCALTIRRPRRVGWRRTVTRSFRCAGRARLAPLVERELRAAALEQMWTVSPALTR